MKFRKKTPAPTPRNLDHIPTGTVIQSSLGYFYIKGNQKIKIISDRILKSWDFPRTVLVTDDCADRFKTNGRMGFREGTVIEDMSTRQTFLISGNQRRLITSPDHLVNLNIDDIMVVSAEEAGIHVRGEDI